jgi:hypothetical protein
MQPLEHDPAAASELGELVAELRAMAGAAGAGRVRDKLTLLADRYATLADRYATRAFLRRIGRQVTPVAAGDRASSRNPHRSYVAPTDYCE